MQKPKKFRCFWFESHFSVCFDHTCYCVANVMRTHTVRWALRTGGH